MSSLPREFIIDGKDKRVFEIESGKIFVEYRGKKPEWPIYVIERWAYDELLKKIETANTAVLKDEKNK
jgi:hypothetical protein